MKNIIQSGLMILVACLGGTKAYLDHKLRMELDQSIKSIADQVTIEYAKVSTSLLGAVVIKNLRLTLKNYTPMQIDTVILHQAYRFYNLPTLPQFISIAIQGIYLPINNTTSSPPVLMSTFGYAPYYLSTQELHALGYNHVNADIHLEAKLYDNKMSILGTMDAEAWGKLKLSSDLTNVPTSLTQNTTIKQIQLSTLTLHYANDILMNRIITHLAQRNRMTQNDFKQALINKLKNDIRQTQMTLDTSVFTSLQQFIQTPNQLTIRLQPRIPITINQLFQTTPKRLGLKMTTT